MPFWFCLLIVAAADEPIETRYAGAVPLYSCDFEEASDDDFDGWPQNWVRRRGPGYPHFLQLKIAREPAPQGAYCFKLNLDGAAAAVTSPPQPFDAGNEYVAEVFVKTTGLVHDEGYLAFRFLDEKKQVVETHACPRFRKVDDWTKVRLGPFSSDNPAVKFVDLEVHLGPTKVADLRGSLAIDDVWIAQLPRKSFGGGRPFNVFPVGEPVELSLTLTGLDEPSVRAELRLHDLEGREVWTEERTSKFDERRPRDPRQFVWQPQLPGVGHYQGLITVYGKQGLIQEEATSVAVVEPLETLRGSEPAPSASFGWSIVDPKHLPHHDELHTLLHVTGVRRLKYPVWYDPVASPEASIKLKKFIERLNVQGIGVIGTLTPQIAALDALYGAEGISAAQVFRQERSQWLPTIEPVLLDLAFKVRAWQLGSDLDHGFEALPGAVDHVRAVKEEFDRIEQDALVGVAWSWINEPPASTRPAWRYLALSADPQPTADELARFLESQSAPGVESWPAVQALPRGDYSLSDRAADLVERLMVAKSFPATATFLVEPFDPETGLFDRAGRPTELYLPWRTMTAALEGAEAAGTLRLPGGSDNRLFLREQDALLVISRPTPGVETADLAGVRYLDLWGRPIKPRVVDGRAVVDVGPTPILALGLDRETFVWDRGCKIEKPQLREVYGEPQPCSLSIVNSFKRAVQGKITIVPPEGWHIKPLSFDVSLAEGEQMSLPFELTLPVTAESGPQLLRIIHDLTGERRREFQLYRQVQVGDGQVVLEVETRLMGDELEVEQRLVNNSNRSVSFRCYLYAPNQRRMRAQIVELAPGTDVRSYRIADGKSLLGKMLWLRAEEVGGDRMLSRRFIVGEGS